MARLFQSAVCCALLALVAAQEQAAISPDSKAVPFTQDDINFFVSEHNRLRRLQSSSNIEEINWDAGLAAVAQNWTSRCFYDHPSSSTFAGYNENMLNENLLITSSWDRNSSLSPWYDEVANYDYAMNDCKNGKMCRHYTQMVWQSSKKLGCALTNCPTVYDPTTGISRNNMAYLMCSYSPPGNWEGALPYLTGPTCSKCPPYSPWCSNGLCTKPTCAVTCGCGTLDERSCTCKCKDGWMGDFCADPCIDKMGTNKCNGYAYLCFNSSYSPKIQNECTKTCGLCVGSNSTGTCV